MNYTIFYVNVKSNICGEMSCLLKQWLVIKCTKDALHLCQLCIGMYVCIISSYVHIKKYADCHIPLLYPYHLRKWWAGRAVLIWKGCGLGGGCLLGGRCLLECRCFIWGNMICACSCVVHIAFIIFADFCLFFKSEKHMQKTLRHKMFPTFVPKQKQTCLCSAKSTEWDINKVQ